MVEVVIPELGDGVEKAKVSFWHYEEGDQVEKNADLVEVATDKATFNIPAPESGIVTQLNFKEDDDVEVGEVIALIDDTHDEFELSNEENGENEY